MKLLHLLWCKNFNVLKFQITVAFASEESFGSSTFTFLLFSNDSRLFFFFVNDRDTSLWFVCFQIFKLKCVDI